jgi:hypothetical protein
MPPTPPEPRPVGTFVAAADLQPNELQDLADQVAELVKAAVGLRLRFRAEIELSGQGLPSPVVVERVNGILRSIHEGFELR